MGTKLYALHLEPSLQVLFLFASTNSVNVAELQVIMRTKSLVSLVS